LEASRQTIDSLESGNLGTAIRDKTMIMNYPEIPDNSNCPLPSSSDDYRCRETAMIHLSYRVNRCRRYIVVSRMRPHTSKTAGFDSSK